MQDKRPDSAHGDQLEKEREELLKLIQESIEPEIIDHINTAFSACQKISPPKLDIAISHGGTSDAEL